MEKSLKGFKTDFLELVLQFLWRQWSALGVAGQVRTDIQAVLDPEALLLFTCTMGRYEPRLFDEVLDWLNVNGSLINVQRLKAVLEQEQFTGGKVLAAIAALPRKGEKTLKWKKLGLIKKDDNHAESLFYHSNAEPMKPFGIYNDHFKEYGLLRVKLELRGYTQPVPVSENATLLLKLRALFGLNARCEILIYLLTHESEHPSQIARKTYYSQKTVQDSLIEMAKSGLVFVQSKGNKKHYWLRRTEWIQFLTNGSQKLKWVTWPPLLRALEVVWLKLNEQKLDSMELLLQSSQLRVLMQQIRPKIEKAGFAEALSDEKQYLGEKYARVFFEDMKRMLAQV